MNLAHGNLTGVSVLLPHGRFISDFRQANILMSNETPPRACLADFDFITVALNHDYELAWSGHFEQMFMPPEFLMPSKFGIAEPMTPEADIYAFALVTFQVCERNLGCRLFLNTSPRSLQANPHSTVPGIRTGHCLWFKGGVQANRRTPHPLGSPICCGVSSSAAGMATRN